MNTGLPTLRTLGESLKPAGPITMKRGLTNPWTVYRQRCSPERCSRSNLDMLALNSDDENSPCRWT